MRERGLRGEQKAEHVEVELLVEVLGRDDFDGSEVVDAGVVDEHIDGAELLHGLRDERPDGIGIGEVGLDGNGLAAGSVDFGNDLFCVGLAAGIVDGDGSAAAASSRAMAAPMPFDAPVTSATFPLRLLIIRSLYRNVNDSTFRQLSN